MNSSRTLSTSDSDALTSKEVKLAFRTKAIATRITHEELAEVETVAERDGKSLADPVELLLSEVAAPRYMLLTLFHATAEARRDSVDLLSEAVLMLGIPTRKYAHHRNFARGSTRTHFSIAIAAKSLHKAV